MKVKSIFAAKRKRIMQLLSFPLFLFMQSVSGQESGTNNDSLQHFRMREISVLGKISNNVLSGSAGIDIDLKKIALLPKLIGEQDAYKALQYLGGVTLSSEANGGLYVRGGNNDQNLVLLNGALVHNPTHVLGMFSVFNTDITSRLRFFKYGIPAEYGGKLSSVVDVAALADIPEKSSVKGAVGLITSRIMTQIPIGRNFSLYASWRGSYIAKIIFPVLQYAGIDSALTKNNYEFWDTNAGFTCKISPKTSLHGSFYKGRDALAIRDIKHYSFDGNTSLWGNTAVTVQLNHLFNDTFSTTHRFCFSNFDLNSSFNWFNSSQRLYSDVRNIVYKADFLSVNKNNVLKFGAEISANITRPNTVSADSLFPVDVNHQINVFHTGLASVFFRDEWTGAKWQINAGVRANVYGHYGPYTDFAANTHYPANRLLKTYWSAEPRFFARYLLSEQQSLKFSATRVYQFLNQIPLISFGLPVDIQLPASIYIEPQSSWHFSGGYFHNFNENTWETSMELYGKTLENQLNFNSEIANMLAMKISEHDLLKGKGRVYGAEWKIQKNAGTLTGWITYNLSWSLRQFDGINKGKPFYDMNDRRHNLSLTGIYRLNDRWSFSALFVLASGSRLNLPLSWYIIDEKTVFEYGGFNSFTLPAYHRLDLSVTRKLRPFRGIKSELILSVYNAYNRPNPFQVYFSRKTQKLQMAYLLPVIPAVSWSFEW